MTDQNISDVRSDAAADLLSVTMAPAAAETALTALYFASARIGSELPDRPRDERDQRAWDAREWLDWLASRIRLAQQEGQGLERLREAMREAVRTLQQARSGDDGRPALQAIYVLEDGLSDITALPSKDAEGR